MASTKIKDLILVGRGRTADVYALDENRVVKLFFAGRDNASVERERQLSNLAFRGGVPTPQCLGVVELEGRLGLVFKRLQGETMLGMFSRKPWRIASLSRQFARLHVQVHSVGVETGLAFSEKIIEGCASTGYGAEVRESVTKLLQNCQETSLVHGDFHPDNIMVTENGLYVIDWSNGARGCAAADVAMSSVTLRAGALPEISPFASVLINAGRQLSHRLYLRSYLKNSRVSPNDVRNWIFAATCYRLSYGIRDEQEFLLTQLRQNKKQTA